MSALPKISHPVFEVVVPSTKKKVRIRPMVVREEKLLLMAKVGGTNNDIYQAIKQVVTNCLLDADVKVNAMTLFDLEFVFLRLRAVSISNIVKVIYRDNEDAKDYGFDVDLDKLEVKFPEKEDMKLPTGPDKGFLMKYPLADLYNSEAFNKAETPPEDLIEELITACIDSYFDGESVYKLSENSKKEVKEFIDNLDIDSYNKIKEFVAGLPKLNYEIKYKNSLDHERTIEMSTLSDFFTP